MGEDIKAKTDSETDVEETHDEALQFSKILKRLLKERDLSHRKASLLAGVSSQVLDSWIKGGTPKDLIAVKRLAKALGVSVAFLIYGEKDSESLVIEDLIKADEKPLISGIYQVEIKKINFSDKIGKR